ncbi:sulfurtransferase complex subunit TusC [Litorivivens sp.]|uniref:sulfurtransferase complex subunit TusC n=1 Tax=Litorivivens sp. TaxID=2020868 RepID=UPI003564E8CB
MSSLLMICRKAPYGTSYAREAIDIALAASAFDLKVAMLFTDDGVYQLLRHQDTTASGSKNVESLLSSLPLYDVGPLLVNQQSLDSRHLSQKDLSMPVQLCQPSEISQLCANYDRVLTI